MTGERFLQDKDAAAGRPVTYRMSSSPDNATSGSSASAIGAVWLETFGVGWRLHVALLGLLVLLLGVASPLSDPDLPMHLAVGEWIVTNRQVPVVEPFAWTRAGEPYYAYSWLIQSVYYLAMAAGGPIALRIINGLVFAGAVVAIYLLGRALSWRPWTVVAMMVLQSSIAIAVAGIGRPQILLLVTVPLAWMMVARAVREDRPAKWLVGLVLVSALAANTHIFFPLTAAPLLWLLVETPRRWTLWVVIPAAVVLGWLISPYGLLWPQVFGFVFTPTALVTFPSPISELVPGFIAGMRVDFRGTPLLWASALALLPWGLMGLRLEPRQIVAASVAWLAGLIGFGIAVRLLLAWWLLVLPFSAWVLDRFTGPQTGRARSVYRTTMYVLLLIFVGVQVRESSDGWAAEGNLEQRTMPRNGHGFIEPLLSYLECAIDEATTARAYTSFEIGSYMTWRMPRLSASIDSRGTFPDSVVRVESFVLLKRGMPPLGPWREADLALLQRAHPVAAVIDTAAGWHRVAQTRRVDADSANMALWVRADWWGRASGRPLAHNAVTFTEGSAVSEDCGPSP